MIYLLKLIGVGVSPNEANNPFIDLFNCAFAFVVESTEQNDKFAVSVIEYVHFLLRVNSHRDIL